jgi:hypothetical protein
VWYTIGTPGNGHGDGSFGTLEGKAESRNFGANAESRNFGANAEMLKY